ncbi:MAG: hypothetical protein M3O35_01940 [Acidobacteriota bacterium]|nr:hypothetical protein [Acidobacteriota bacterium]
MKLPQPDRPRSILTGIVLLAIAGSALPASAASVPFALNFSGSASTDTGFAPAVSTGTISPFGQATAALMFSGAVTVRGTFTLLDGSSFTGTFTGPAPGAFHPHDNVVITFGGDITSGTGNFKDATGTLQGTVTIYDINPGVPSNYTLTGSGSVTVQDTGSGGLSALPLTFGFRLAEGGTSSASQGLTLQNQGLSAVAFQAVGSVSSGSNWLSVAPASGSVPPGSTFLLNVTASVSGARAGIYNGQVVVTFAGGSLTLFVQLVVAPAGPNLQLSQKGITFDAISGASPPPAHTIVAANTGTGSLAGLTATATVLKSDRKWLSAAVLPSVDGQRFQVNISVDQTGLMPGTYSGRVDVAVNGAANSPQSVIVVLYLNPDDLYYGASINVDSQSFYYEPPSPPSGPNHVVITNLCKRPLTFSTQISYATAGLPAWLSASPASGVVDPGKSVTVLLSVSPLNPLPLVPGAPPHGTLYRGFLQMGFAEIKQTWGIAIAYAADPNLTATGAPQPMQQTTACTTTQLAALFAPLGDPFQINVAAPVPLQVQVLDDCGRSVDTGSMVVTFSAGDPPLPLVPIGNGRWAATWVPRKAGPQTITVNAQTNAASGTATLNTSVTANTNTPAIGGVGSAASGATTIAPGEFIAIYGSNMASATTVTQSVPFPPSLGDTQVIIGGRVLPLYFTSTGQIDAIVPYDLPQNSVQQIIVQSGAAYSQPEVVTVSAAHAGVFTQNQSGTGPGAILGQKPGGVPALNTPANPASAGDALLIFCTGLGTVSPSVPAGSAAPFALFSTDNQVTATVGGQTAQVLFAGLAPGYVGLYQVNLIVPAGITPGPNVPVVLSAAGADSVPVTVAIK